jgi:hypothetical protein
MILWLKSRKKLNVKRTRNAHKFSRIKEHTYIYIYILDYIRGDFYVIVHFRLKERAESCAILPHRAYLSTRKRVIFTEHWIFCSLLCFFSFWQLRQYRKPHWICTIYKNDNFAHKGRHSIIFTWKVIYLFESRYYLFPSRVFSSRKWIHFSNWHFMSCTPRFGTLRSVPKFRYNLLSF